MEQFKMKISELIVRILAWVLQIKNRINDKLNFFLETKAELKDKSALPHECLLYFCQGRVHCMR